MSSSTQEDYLIVGAGFTGAVLERIRGSARLPGNGCGIAVARGGELPHEARWFHGGYGAPVWAAYFQYESVARLGLFASLRVLRPFVNRVKASTSRGIFSLPASILKRIPIRFNDDDNYYNSAQQGIPKHGTRPLWRKFSITRGSGVRLSTPFDRGSRSEYDHTFYTGPIDAYFEFALGRLGYRTITFERIESAGDYQGNAVINYTGLEQRVAHDWCCRRQLADDHANKGVGVPAAV